MAPPKGSHNIKANTAESLARTDQVFDLLVKGASRSDIIQFFAKEAEKKEIPAPTVRAVDFYIRKANDQLKDHSTIYRDREIGLAIRRLTDIYKNCRLVQDWSRALAAQKELNALLGLYPEQSLTVFLTADQDRALKAAGVDRQQLIADVIAELLGEPAQALALPPGGEQTDDLEWEVMDPSEIDEPAAADEH